MQELIRRRGRAGFIGRRGELAVFRENFEVPPDDGQYRLTAELAANAALHGRVPGRDFRLTLTLDAVDTLRVEVTDPRGDRLPRTPDPAGGHAGSESGRGLILVAAFADRWGVDEGPAPCKTVWAEVALLPDRGLT